MEVPPAVIVRDKAAFKERVAAYQEVCKIVNELESAALTCVNRVEKCHREVGREMANFLWLRSCPQIDAAGPCIQKIFA